MFKDIKKLNKKKKNCLCISHLRSGLKTNCSNIWRHQTNASQPWRHSDNLQQQKIILWPLERNSRSPGKLF